jgi:hypothetical protein
MDPWAHIQAEVTFLPPSEGGRATLAILRTTAGKYRPHIVLGDPNQRHATTVGNQCQETYLGVMFVSGPEHFQFGEPVSAEAVLMYYPLPEHESVIPGRPLPFGRDLTLSVMVM